MNIKLQCQQPLGFGVPPGRCESEQVPLARQDGLLAPQDGLLAPQDGALAPQNRLLADRCESEQVPLILEDRNSSLELLKSFGRRRARLWPPRERALDPPESQPGPQPGPQPEPQPEPEPEQKPEVEVEQEPEAPSVSRATVDDVNSRALKLLLHHEDDTKLLLRRQIVEQRRQRTASLAQLEQAALEVTALQAQFRSFSK